MAILNNNDELVSFQDFRRANPNISFSSPVSQETLDYLGITDYHIGDAPTTSNPLLSDTEVIKAKRNKLLADSDFTQLRDVVLSNDADWIAYRQALRDLPEQESYPDNVVWPVRPGDSPITTEVLE